MKAKMTTMIRNALQIFILSVLLFKIIIYIKSYSIIFQNYNYKVLQKIVIYSKIKSIINFLLLLYLKSSKFNDDDKYNK